jgi:hypothetical protein
MPPKPTLNKPYADNNFDAATDYAKKMAEQNLLERQRANLPAYGDPAQQTTPITGGNQPYFMPQTAISHMPVQYEGPSNTKAELSRRNEIAEQTGVVRTLPIDKELDYMKYMEDMQELAKFDNYVEALVDPKAPGSADFLFKVYPEYVNRRMSQAQADYEFALRNQMIDMWGINSFDDLYFKYMVDQGAISGPFLQREAGKQTADDNYVSYAFLPGRFKRPFNPKTLKLPYTSSKVGSKSTGVIDRQSREMPYSDVYVGDENIPHGSWAAERGPMAMFRQRIGGTDRSQAANMFFSNQPGNHGRTIAGTTQAQKDP